MASHRLRTNKKGERYYEIQVSRGYGISPYTKRWYPPKGWSQKTIDQRLKKVEEEFQQQCEAGEVLTKREQKARKQREAQEAAKILTLRQYGEQVFMPAIKITASENTRSSYQGQLENHIYPTLGDMKTPDFSSANITALLLDLQGKGMAHASVIKVYTVLSSMFKRAYKNDLIEKNPMDKVDRPKPRKDEAADTEVHAYTIEELQYIMECLEKEPLKWRAFIHLLIDTGARRGEIAGLKWEDVDFETNHITIRGNLQYTPQRGVYLDTPKTKKFRELDVADGVMLLLRELRTQVGTAPYVFSQKDSIVPMHPQSLTKYMKKLEKKYGIADFHPHHLRHTLASIAILSGADIASVSQKLGHSDIATTLRMYTHANPESVKRAGDIFRDALKKTDREQK